MVDQAISVLKTNFGTSKIPTGVQFADFIDSTIRPFGVRPIEYFGATAVSKTSSPINNITAMQTAADWSAAGGVVTFGAGKYGFDGTLTLSPYTAFVGQGGTTIKTILQQMNTSWPNCLVGPPVSGSSGGTSNVTLIGICVDGSWDLQNSFGTGGNWNYLLASKNQKGIWLDSPDSGANALNDENSPDTHNFIFDVAVRNVAGVGLYLDGRGEMLIDKIRIYRCATIGFYLDSPDNWVNNATISTCGDKGFVISSGNQRIADIKSWFIGMCKGEEPSGFGLEIAEGSGNANIDCVNMSTQDTWGPGMKLEGITLSLRGRIDEAGGGRLEQQGNGWTGTRTKDRTALEIGTLKDSDINVQVKGTDRGLSSLPHLISFRNSGPTMNVIRLTTNRSAAVPYLHSTLVETTAGYNSAKRWNLVQSFSGDILHGTKTVTQLNDVTEDINVYGKAGLQVFTDAYRPLWKSGDTAASPWKDAAGTTV